MTCIIQFQTSENQFFGSHNSLDAYAVLCKFLRCKILKKSLEKYLDNKIVILQ